jgi:hypothetical protein
MDLAMGGENLDLEGNPVFLGLDVLPGSGDGTFPSQAPIVVGPGTNMGPLPSRPPAVSVGDINDG